MAMLVRIFALALIVSQITNGCRRAYICPYALFLCNGNIIIFECEISTKTLNFEYFTFGKLPDPNDTDCTVTAFPPHDGHDDMGFVNMQTDTRGTKECQIRVKESDVEQPYCITNCGVQGTRGRVEVNAGGTTSDGKPFRLRFYFQGCRTGQTKYIAEIDDPDGVVECLCENGGTCVTDYENANLTCICPPGYTGKLCEQAVYRPCEEREYVSYSRRDCQDSYTSLTKDRAYEGLTLQQYTWQCDHRYDWNSQANANNLQPLSNPEQKAWLISLLQHVLDLLSDKKNGEPWTRKEYRVATQAERDAFHAAINTLKTTSVGGQFMYDILASFHLSGLALGAHGGAAFLPWHRVYLLMYELALRSFDSNVVLLYWDSTLEQGLRDPSWSLLWSENYLGNGNGDVTTGPFANWMARDGRKLTRNVNPCSNSLTTLDDVAAVLSRTQYGQLVPLVENIHGTAHSYVGGHMGDINHAPNDPVFWMHHAFIDCLWEEFRENSQNAAPGPAIDYAAGASGHHHRNAFMQPFATLLGVNIRNKQGLSLAFKNCYNCSKRPTCPECGNSGALFCDHEDNRCKPFTMEGHDCDKDCAFVNAKIYCENRYDQTYYGVNGVYLESTGVTYKGRRRQYYNGDYHAYYNREPVSYNPATYRPCYNGYFVTRTPLNNDRVRYYPQAYTVNGAPCRVECLTGYTNTYTGPANRRRYEPQYGPCPTGGAVLRQDRYVVSGTYKYRIPYSTDYNQIYNRYPDSEYQEVRPPSRRNAEYYRVTCPCGPQQYTYCPRDYYGNPGYPPKDCVYGLWSPWECTGCSGCSRPCGGGSKTCTETRTRRGVPSCNPRNQTQTRTVTRPCNTQKCCKWGLWSKWICGECVRVFTEFAIEKQIKPITFRCEQLCERTRVCPCDQAKLVDERFEEGSRGIATSVVDGNGCHGIRTELLQLVQQPCFGMSVQTKKQPCTCPFKDQDVVIRKEEIP